MRVIDQEPYSWFLLEDGNHLYLEVYCNHSFAAFSRLILLNAVELEKYQAGGHAYLTELAADVQYFALTTYRERHLSGEIDQRVTDAVRVFYGK